MHTAFQFMKFEIFNEKVGVRLQNFFFLISKSAPDSRSSYLEQKT